MSRAPVTELSSQVEALYRELIQSPGFSERPGQIQLSLLLADLMQSEKSGAFEAPTGLGKSLAVLLPAMLLANQGRRVVVSTYTNVLAEQYWYKDIPLALSLLPEDLRPKVQILEGKSRYACVVNTMAKAPDVHAKWFRGAKLGIESEVSRLAKSKLPWNQLNAPEACPGRYCSEYNKCFYYNARSAAQRANLIVTNHAVVLQHALIARDGDGEGGLLGEIDYLIFDEAHDLASAARSALDFEIHAGSFDQAEALLVKIGELVGGLASRATDPTALFSALTSAHQGLQKSRALWQDFDRTTDAGMLFVSPQNLVEHPAVKQALKPTEAERAALVAQTFGGTLLTFADQIERLGEEWGNLIPERSPVGETLKSYLRILSLNGEQSMMMSDLTGVSVTYTARDLGGLKLRSEVVDVAPVLQEIIWEKWPTASLSATLALDGDLTSYKDESGCRPDFEEILPSPFDFATQAAVYVPEPGKIPDPSQARRGGFESEYFSALANEIQTIIQAMEGRTLVLFSSRREMQEVYDRMRPDPRYPILIQAKFGNTNLADRFKSEVATSLFALRSFWTGFDAPGETLSCAVLVRIPFEVPTDPAAIVRAAHLVSQGRDPFSEYTLAQAKKIMRQGAGRLVRTDSDRGVLALLDPRLRSKRYGEQILENLPRDLRIFSDFGDAVAIIGLK